ncbi:hypothetical protein [Kitasatospora sp. NPDC056184]|uniref:hypothetical protein n=1 Tax=Kitasatospora sp. NPDC056184 TaxID=3345738 RepID=UPI0035D835A5
MIAGATAAPALFAAAADERPSMNGRRRPGIGDLHVGYPESRAIVEDLPPESGPDRLPAVRGVGEIFADAEWAPGVLRSRFAAVRRGSPP